MKKLIALPLRRPMALPAGRPSPLPQGGIPAGYAAWVTGTTVWRIADARIISPVRT